MRWTYDHTPFLRSLFPEAKDGLLRLYESAATNANLVHADFYTVRDLLDLSGYAENEVVHVLLLALVLALDEGSSCVEASEAGLTRRLAGLVEDDEARDWAARVVRALDADGFPALITVRPHDAVPVVRRRARDRTYLYFQRYLRHETVLRTELRKRLTSDPTERPDLPAVLQEVLHDRPLCLAGRPVRLNRDQQRALVLALLRDFLIISGGPGTGKTSIVVTLLRCLARCGYAPERITLAAPTGRAAQRLTDSVRAGLERLDGTPADAALRGLTAQTLHHLLRYSPHRGSFLHHAENPLPADVVIVDESSMVGLVLMGQLFQALRPTTRLILLGDKDQLPSVDAGAVLANLVALDGRPCYSRSLCARAAAVWADLALEPADTPHPLRDALVILEENFRSQQTIQDVARAVNRQDADVVDRLPRFPLKSLVLAAAPAARRATVPSPFTGLDEAPGCRLLDPAGADMAAWRYVLDQWAEQHYLSAPADGEAYRDLVARCEGVATNDPTPEQKDLLDRLFRSLDRARVLTLLREGAWGCSNINLYIEQLLRPRLDRRGVRGLFAGMPTLITRNDHVRQLYNGDVGITLRGPGGYRVVFQRHGGYLAVPVEALPAHETAFALTVHKSQGSEYGRVLLVLPPEGGGRLLTKEMIYTGITRAKHWVAVCATEAVLRAAIARRVVRESGLLEEDAGA